MVRGKAEGGLKFAPGPGGRGQAGEAGGLRAAAGSSPDSPWLGAQARVGISLSSLSGFVFLPEAPGAAAKQGEISLNTGDISAALDGAALRLGAAPAFLASCRDNCKRLLSPETLLCVNTDSPTLPFPQVSLLCKQFRDICAAKWGVSWNGVHHETACGRTRSTTKRGARYQVSRHKSGLSKTRWFTSHT